VVVLQDDSTYEAQLVGMDEDSDLAVLKIDAHSLTPAIFGDAEEMTVGNACVAIGNPLGETFRGTMTTGIISALNRNVSVSGHYMTLIQTDCAINSGNSGGPLINLYGQVIGICNMKMMSSSTTVEGLGFAIPTNTVKTIVNKLLSQGEVIRAMLGITAYNLDQSECRSYGIDGGIMVVQVSAEADAYTKGIRNGDIIIAANGVAISTVNQLNTLKADMSPGDVLTLTVLRDGEELDVDVMLMEQSVVY
jgi:serine protease Do